MLTLSDNSGTTVVPGGCRAHNDNNDRHRQNIMTTQELETLLGRQRGNIIVNSTDGISKQAVRNWMTAQGCERDVVNGVTLDQMRAVVNDTSDEELRTALSAISAKGGAYVRCGDTDQPSPAAEPVTVQAPAPAAPAASLGMMDQVINGLIDARLAGHKPGVDRAEVEAIANAVMNGAQVDVNPASVESALDNRQSAIEAAMQSRLETALAPVQPMLDALANDATVNTSPRTPVISAVAAGNPLMTKLAPYYQPGKDVGVPVLVTSPPSFGKSYTIRELGKSYDVYLEHGCSDDMDEIATMQGTPSPDGEGGFAIADGVLAEAVRAAAEGKTTLVLLDEVLRWPETVQAWLLTFMTGFQHNGEKWYRLRTRHVVDGSWEVIECRAHYLHIVAAANLTMTMPVQAFWSRFWKIRVEFSKAYCETTAAAILNAKGITHSGKLAKTFANVMNESRVSVKQAKTAQPVDFRLLEFAAMTAPDPTEKSVGQRIAEGISDAVAVWDGDLGDTDTDSAALANGWANALRTL